MKKIMISIRPEWVVKILNGEKTIEIRKTMPKCELPCEVYIYCTKEGGTYNWLAQTPMSMKRVARNQLPNFLAFKSTKQIQRTTNCLNGKVVAKFTMYKCIRYKSLDPLRWHNGYNDYYSCLDYRQVQTYRKNKAICLWIIDNLEILEEPKTLADFGIKRAPQSWCYIKEGK